MKEHLLYSCICVTDRIVLLWLYLCDYEGTLALYLWFGDTFVLYVCDFGVAAILLLPLILCDCDEPITYKDHNKVFVRHYPTKEYPIETALCWSSEFL